MWKMFHASGSARTADWVAQSITWKSTSKPRSVSTSRLTVAAAWAGCLSVNDYRRYALPYVQEIVAALPPGVPVINFATGNPALLPLLADAGDVVVGVDWRIGLDQAWKSVGSDHAVQGNLDPAVLLATPPEIRSRAASVLKEAAGRPGHIFNLGHGVLQQTPVENAIALVEAVHELSAR